MADRIGHSSKALATYVTLGLSIPLAYCHAPAEISEVPESLCRMDFASVLQLATLRVGSRSKMSIYLASTLGLAAISILAASTMPKAIGPASGHPIDGRCSEGLTQGHSKALRIADDGISKDIEVSHGLASLSESSPSTRHALGDDASATSRGQRPTSSLVQKI